MRKNPAMLVLDKPAAVLDPETEHELFGRFEALSSATLSTGGISLIVSHRLFTVRSADLILVFRDGRLVE